MNIILGIMGIFILATIGGIAWFELKIFKEILKEPSFKEPPFNPEIQDQERDYVARILAYETKFFLTPSYALHHMPLYKDSDEKYVMEFYSNDHFRLKVHKVSCYSDNSGVTNYRGFIYSLMYKKTVLKNYFELDDFIKDYKKNFSYFVKQRTIIARLKDLEKDFV